MIENEFSLVERADHLHAAGKQQQLLELAETIWPAPEQAEILPGTAEVCRYTFLLLKGRRDSRAFLWFARALTAAVLTGARDTAAGLVLRDFFVSLEEGDHDSARLVLDEVRRLVDMDSPRADLFRGRIYHEKYAYSLALEGRFNEACDHYQLAARYCRNDPRGRLKVEGGAVIAGYLALERMDHEALKSEALLFIENMKKIQAAASAAGFVEVERTAARNLALMQTASFSPWFPFETT